jgi:hypothetical protein
MKAVLKERKMEKQLVLKKEKKKVQLRAKSREH